jgi:hypothetical protein
MPSTSKPRATRTTRNPKPQAAETEAAKPNKAEAAKAEAAAIKAERADAATVFAKLSEAVSIPIKPKRAFAYRADVPPHSVGRKPSARQAAALAVAAAATGKPLADGLTMPRVFTMRGATYAIENGCLADMQRSGLASYDAETETVTLRNAAELRSQLGKKLSGFKL